jgi:hypothetical protein
MVKYYCGWKTVANFVIYNADWEKKIDVEGNRQIKLPGMPIHPI